MGGNSDKNKKYAYLSRLDTQTLETLLRADMDAPDGGDTDMVMYIMEVIGQREQDNSAEHQADTERAFQEFQERYNIPEGVGHSLYPDSENEDAAVDAEVPNSLVAPRQTHNRRHLRRTLAIAAVVACTIVFMIPPVLGYESFLRILGYWTAETFHFDAVTSAPAISEPAEPDFPQTHEPKDYQDLQEALDDYGIVEAVVPTWIPDGFELDTIQVSDSPEFRKTVFNAFYVNGDRTVSILIVKQSSFDSRQYEKDSNPVREYVVGDITHYLFQNNGRQVSSWYQGHLECAIKGDITIDELIAMIDSIYER